jgi:hypothetical protein
VSPTIHHEDGFVFYFVSFDITSGEPPHVHVGKGSQQPKRDAKIWLDPISVAREGYFNRQELQDACAIVRENQAYFLEEWNDYKDRR